MKSCTTNANFYNVLADGSTDASITEKEVIFTIHFDPSTIGEDRVKICTSYLDLADLKNANSRGFIEAINESFKIIGIDTCMDKLVNCRKKKGVKTLLQESNEWLGFGWCVAHRLKLSLKDSLKATSFTDVDDMIYICIICTKSHQRN